MSLPVSPADAAPTPATFQSPLALAAGERHGYGIMREVEALSEGRVPSWARSVAGALTPCWAERPPDCARDDGVR